MTKLDFIKSLKSVENMVYNFGLHIDINETDLNINFLLFEIFVLKMLNQDNQHFW